jgi:AraC family transcriptional regulator
MELIIKNMVCNRCVIVVSNVLAELRIEAEIVTQGQVLLKAPLTAFQLSGFSRELNKNGFEILDDSKKIIIEKVKNNIIAIIHSTDGITVKTNFSQIIRDATGTDYNTVSALFSRTEGITIEQFIISQRIERAKELLAYDELNLGEIALKLGYSSLQHLSTQFKKVTGTTPSAFKKSRAVKRLALDAI